MPTQAEIDELAKKLGVVLGDSDKDSVQAREEFMERLTAAVSASMDEEDRVVARSSDHAFDHKLWR